MERTPRRTNSLSNSRYPTPNSRHSPTQYYPEPPQNFASSSPSSDSQNYQQMPMVFDASTKKKGRGLSVDLSDAQYQARLHAGDREKMKEILADSFSRNETISILPGFKDDNKMPVKPCIKLGHSSSHTMNLTLGDKPPYAYNQWSQSQSQHQNFAPQQQSRTNSSTSDPRYETKHHHSTSHVNSNWDSHNETPQDNNQPWPYGQQKSQRSIREAQAAYKRDLDRQVEEKINREKPIRKLPNNNNNNPSKSPECQSSKPVNQSVSLEAFRNTGFLPPWFDPIRNNPLYNTTNPNHPEGDNEVEEHHHHHQEIQKQDEQKYTPKIPVDFQPTLTPIKFFPGSPRLHPQATASGNYYIVSQSQCQEIINQLAQQQQQGQGSNSCQPPPVKSQVLQPPPNVRNLEPQQQHSWTPWLNAQLPVNSTPVPLPMSISTPMMTMKNGVTSTRGRDSSPDPTRIPTDTDEPEYSNYKQESPGQGQGQQSKFKSEANLIKQNTNWSQPQTQPDINFGHGGETEGDDEGGCHDENLDSPMGQGQDGQDYPYVLTPHVSQTASQRPDEEVMKVRYKSQLAKQIEEKKRLEQEKLSRQMEEDAKFQKKIEQDQRRMAAEYEEEQRQHKIRQDEYKKRQDMILKEKERFDREAEDMRNKRKLERRRSRVKTPKEEQPENKGNDKNSTIYESPVDLTLCAASKWASQDRAKSPQKSETSSESQMSEPIEICNSDSPRPRTVVISHHHHQASVGMKREEMNECGEINRQFNNKYQDNRQDVSFLLDIRKAIIAEDQRIGNIIKKKERFFVTF